MIESREGRAGAAGSWMRARVAFVMAGVMAAGCGGGGGGVSAPPPAPVLPTITLTADTTSVSAGDGPIAVRLAISDSSPPQWSLAGPGQLVAGTNGAWMDYVPPDSESLDAVSTATITVYAGAAAQRLVFSLAPSTLPGHVWTTVKAPAPFWKSVAAGNGGFVAGAATGELWQSIDGQSWTPRHPATPFGLFSVIWNGTRWLGADLEGDIASSADGTTWIDNGSVASGGSFPQLAWGNGTYVMAEDVPGSLLQNMVSSDGISWTSATTGPAPIGVAFGHGRFVGVSSAGIATSVDGLAWTTLPGTPTTLTEVAFGNGVFVAATHDQSGTPYDEVATSPDGLVWTTSTPPDLIIASPTGLSFANGLFFAQSGYGTLTSTDGQSWTLLPRAFGDAGFSSVAWAAGRYVGVTPDGAISTSANGTSWVDVVGASAGALLAVDVSGGVAIATSDRGWALRSPDQQHWSRVRIGDDTHSVAARALAFGNGIHVAVGTSPLDIDDRNDGIVYFSADGLGWTAAQVSSPNQAFVGVTFDGRRFVALNDHGGVFASTDGATWSTLSTLPGLGGSFFATAIAFGGGQYVALGSGFVATSPDAVQWTTSATATIQPNVGETGETYNAIVFDGTRFVAVGYLGATAVSTDGTTWTAARAPFNSNFTGLATANGILVAVGGDTLSVATSADGAHWTMRNLPEGATTGLRAITFANGAFIGVGGSSEILSSIH